jgi:hypothetical protein
MPAEIPINHEVNDCDTKREAFCLGVDCGQNRMRAEITTILNELEAGQH